jgi:AraC-like DNA-binding protein
MKDAVIEYSNPSNGNTSRARLERNRVGAQYPDGRLNRFNGSGCAKQPGQLAAVHAVFLPPPVIAQALESRSLGTLLPVAAGGCTHGAGKTPGHSTGIGQLIVLYCSAGRGWCELFGRRYGVSAGGLLIIPHDASHVLGASPDQPWTISWVRVAGANLDGLPARLGATLEKPVLEVGEEPQLLALFDKLFDDLEAGCTQSHLLRAVQTLARLLDVIGRQQLERSRGDQDAHRKILQSMAYMKAHLDQPLRVATLAAQANISLPHYFALFKRLTGHTPIDYFIHLRMQRAGQLLNTMSLSVKEVAGMLGYDDPFYFSRMFKSVHAVAPSEYRARQENGKNHKGSVNGQALGRSLRQAEDTQRQLVSV